MQLISNVCFHQLFWFLSCYFCEYGWQWEAFTLSTAGILEQFIQYLDSFPLWTVQDCGWDLPGPWTSLSVTLSSSFLICSETHLFIYSCSSLGSFGFSCSYTCTPRTSQMCSQLFRQLDLSGRPMVSSMMIDAVPADKMHWQEARSTCSSLPQTNYICSSCFILSLWPRIGHMTGEAGIVSFRLSKPLV